MPEFPESSYPKTSNNSNAVDEARRAEHGRRVAMLLESRTRLLRGNPPEYHVHDSTGRFVGLVSDPTRALEIMRRRGIGSSVRYRSGTLVAALVTSVRGLSPASVEWLAERWDPDVYGREKESVGTPEIQITAQTAQAGLELHERFEDTENADGRVARTSR